jgi:integrase
MSWEREGDGRIRWVTPQEEQSMMSLLKDWEEDEVAAFLTVLIETGMRRGELLRLQPKDVEEGRWAHLWITKTKKSRSVPLTPKAANVLQDHLPWSLDEVKLRSVWGKLRESMGLKDDKDFVLHTLRHTTATRLLKKSRNITVVQKMLGHRKAETTLRYAHIDDQDLFNAVVN